MKRVILLLFGLASVLSSDTFSSAPSSIIIQFSQSNTVNVTGTTSATTLLTSTNAIGSLTLPANFLNVLGAVLHLHYQGTWNQNGTATANDLYTISLGGTTIATGQGGVLFASTASTNKCMLDLVFTTNTIGSSGALSTNGGMICDLPGLASGPSWIPFVSSVNTVNLTGTLVFNLTVTPGATAHGILATNVVLSNI